MIVLRINWNVKLTGPAANESYRRNPARQEARWDIFQRFTFPSLQRQTEPNWQAWLICDPAMSDLTDPMLQHLQDPRVKLIYDLPAAIRTLAAKAPQELVYLRLDSDDLLHSQAMARLSEELPGLVQFGYGYMLDIQSGRLYEWNHPSSCFIARIGDYRMLTAGAPNLGGNHIRVHHIARRIDARRWYMVLVHGHNLCSTTDRPWVGRELMDMERASVLTQFGVDHVH